MSDVVNLRDKYDEIRTFLDSKVGQTYILGIKGDEDNFIAYISQNLNDMEICYLIDILSKMRDQLNVDILY